MAHPSQRTPPTGPRQAVTYGLISNPTKCGARELIVELISRLGAQGWQPLCDEATHGLLGSPAEHPAVTSDVIAEKSDLIIEWQSRSVNVEIPDDKFSFEIPQGLPLCGVGAAAPADPWPASC